MSSANNVDYAYGPLVREIAGVLKSKRSVAILTHNSADGDTLGSGLAMALALEKLDKRVSLIYEEQIPDDLSVLPLYPGILTYLPDDGEGASERAFESIHERVLERRNTSELDRVCERGWDAIVVMDTADVKLLGKRARLLEQSGCVINVDHHVTNMGFGTYNLIDADASASAEIAYRLVLALGVPLDRDIALCIYTGICTDTGGFSYSNTSAECHEIAAKTLAFGLDVAHLRYKFFDQISLGKLHCTGYVANRLRFSKDGRHAVVVVPASALDELGADEADCEGLVNIGRNVLGVEVSVFAREVKPGEFRINLRSRGEYDVAAVARKFDGGGHKLAAGCTIHAAPSDIEAILFAAL